MRDDKAETSTTDIHDGAAEETPASSSTHRSALAYTNEVAYNHAPPRC